CIYRVEASQREPKLSAFLPRPNRLSQERQTVAIPRGNRVAAMLAVQRHGLDGAVDLQLKSLPGGVSATQVSIPPDRFWTPIVLEARPDPPRSGPLAEVIASAKVGQRPVTGSFIQVVDLVAGSADALFQSASVNRLAVAVIEEAPFKLSLENAQTALAQDGTLGLQIRAD